MAMPPQFMKKAAGKTAPKAGAKPNPFAKGAKGAKMCPGCKDPACKKAGKCAKSK